MVSDQGPQALLPFTSCGHGQGLVFLEVEGALGQRTPWWGGLGLLGSEKNLVLLNSESEACVHLPWGMRC